VAKISGEYVYKHLKYEGGVHKVQRVPETENKGRVHSSTCQVIVLPEAKLVNTVIDERDLKIDCYRASGAGGQHVKENLKKKIKELEFSSFHSTQNENRKKQMGSGNLNEKIRTYNWPDSRVTGIFNNN